MARKSSSARKKIQLKKEDVLGELESVKNQIKVIMSSKASKLEKTHKIKYLREKMHDLEETLQDI